MRDESLTPAIQAIDICKSYPGSPPVEALKNESLSINDNEFFTLLGPSGCGKTTLLRLIAGFEDLTSGELRLYGEDISSMPPEKRPINTVFQHYALFPHMTVVENVAFGLRRRGTDVSQAQKTALEMLDLVQMSQFANRRPSQLSGGQQQRVSLARALAPHPKVLLLDEPLSALDLKLRQSMRTELKRLQRETGITFVFVTHDQEEALSMSDRIAVMSAGRVQQIASPSEIYEQPRNRFVADFIGDANFFQGKVTHQNGNTARFRISPEIEIAARTENTPPAGDVTLFVRPEKLDLLTSATSETLPGDVREISYLGNTTDYAIDLRNGPSIVVRSENHHNGDALALPGDAVHVGIDPSAVRVLEA